MTFAELGEDEEEDEEEDDEDGFGLNRLWGGRGAFLSQFEQRWTQGIPGGVGGGGGGGDGDGEGLKGKGGKRKRKRVAGGWVDGLVVVHVRVKGVLGIGSAFD